MPSSERERVFSSILLTVHCCWAIYEWMRRASPIVGKIFQLRRTTLMNKNVLVPVILFICVLFIRIGTPAAEDNMAKIKKEQSAMNAIIEQFARDKNICNDEEEKIKFAITPYLESKDTSQWTEEIKKTINSCQEKYMVNMDYKGTQSIYLYCYDGQIPKLMAPAPDSSENRKNCPQGK
jgi:uncharacterized membrane protein